jgi:hypothetical protein
MTKPRYQIDDEVLPPQLYEKVREALNDLPKKGRRLWRVIHFMAGGPPSPSESRLPSLLVSTTRAALETHNKGKRSVYFRGTQGPKRETEATVYYRAAAIALYKEDFTTQAIGDALGIWQSHVSRLAPSGRPRGQHGHVNWEHDADMLARGLTLMEVRVWGEAQESLKADKRAYELALALDAPSNTVTHRALAAGYAYAALLRLAESGTLAHPSRYPVQRTQHRTPALKHRQAGGSVGGTADPQAQ